MDEVNAVNAVSVVSIPTVVSFDDMFVTEKDIFDVSVAYYKENGKLFAEIVDSDFDMDKKTNSAILTFKYPSQGDTTVIANHVFSKGIKTGENLDILEFNRLELARMACLLRKWNVDKPITNENVMNLHPKIVKAILAKIRDVISTEGIF